MELHEAAARELLGHVTDDGKAKGGALRDVHLEDLQSADVKEYLVRRTSKAAAKRRDRALVSRLYARRRAGMGSQQPLSRRAPQPAPEAQPLHQRRGANAAHRGSTPRRSRR